MSKFCSECGAEDEKSANFCTQCGTAIKQTVKKKKSISEPSLVTPPLPPMVETSKNIIYKKQDINGFYQYQESGKINVIRLVILVALGLIAAIYTAYGYTFLIDKFTGAIAETGRTGGRGGLIVLGLILLVPVIGLALINLSISYISASRNKTINVVIFVALALICWYYGNAYAVGYRFSVALGLDTFPSFTFFPRVGMSYVFSYAFNEDWFLTLLHLLELAIFILIAVVTGTINSYYCEKCNKRMDSTSYYVISDLPPNDYLKDKVKNSAVLLKQTVLKKEELLVQENIEDKYFYHCELSQCPSCEEKIVELKRVQLVQDNDKKKIEDKEKVATGIYLSA